MRCFVAIELPTRVREQLADLQARLQELDRFVRWTRPEQIHLTLKFLGEVPDGQVPDICSALIEAAAHLQPPTINVRDVSCFPGNNRARARVVWAGVAGPPPELVACYETLERAFADLGYPPEKRAFKPHLTIGRSRQPEGAREIRSLLSPAQNFRCEPFVATELTLFQSVLGHHGPTYTVLTHATFRG